MTGDNLGPGDHYNMDSGKIQNIIDPQPEDFDYGSMVRSLSRETRYSGDCDQNVAQHLILTKDLADSLGYTTRLQIKALIHDIEESLLGDKPLPKKEMQDEAYKEGLKDFYRQLKEDYSSLPDEVPEEHIDGQTSFDKRIKQKEEPILEAQYERLSEEFEEFDLEPPTEEEKQKIKTVDKMANWLEPFVYGANRSSDPLRNGQEPEGNPEIFIDNAEEEEIPDSIWARDSDLSNNPESVKKWAEKGFPLYLYYDSDKSARAFDRHFRELLNQL